MAEYTPNLNLLKKDPVADGNDTFNIQTMLNDNWDKIDDFAKAIEEGLGNVDDVEQVVGDLIEQVGNLEELDTETKTNLIGAINEIYQDLMTHKAEYVQLKGEIKNFQNYSTYKSNVDVNGIFQEIQYKRADGTLMLKSVLSGGTSPEYTTRTVTIYENDGITVKNTYTYSITYTDGKPVSEVLV